MEFKETYNYVVSCLIDKKPDERPGLIDAINEILKGNNVILSAPPSYGKTNIPYTLAYLTSEKMGPWASRVIHILPLRSIIEDVYRRLFIRITDNLFLPKIESLNRKAVARQMMSFSESPYLQKTLVLTTIDTFTLTSIRIPPIDILNIKFGLSLGHGEYSRAAILTSIPIFDEIQLFLEEDKRLATILFKLIEWLSYTKTPTLLMSATLPSLFEAHLARRLNNVKVLRYGRDFRSKDFEYKKQSNMVRSNKLVIQDINELIHKATNFLKEGNYSRILIVTNTIKKCINLSLGLMDFNPIILHSKIIAKDRLIRLSEIASRDKWFLISTQVVEAGVDLSSDAMITEIAPPTSIVQRIGRLLRKEENEEGYLMIFYDMSESKKEKYTVYPMRIVQEAFQFISLNLKRINWHLPQVNNKIGYEKFMEYVYLKSDFSPKIEYSISNILSKLLFKFNVNPSQVISLMDFYGNIVRDSPMISGLVKLDSKIKFKDKDEYSIGELREIFVENSFPLNLYDLKMLSKHVLKALKLNTKGYITCFKLDLKKLIDNKFKIYTFINRNNVIAIIIPRELYDNKYGFRVT